MNPLANKALVSALRHLLSGPIGWLVGRGIWPESDAAEYLTAFVAWLAAWLWSQWENYQDRLKLLVAQALPAGKTELQVETTVAMGLAPNVNTPKDVVPVLKQ